MSLADKMRTVTAGAINRQADEKKRIAAAAAKDRGRLTREARARAVNDFHKVEEHIREAAELGVYETSFRAVTAFERAINQSDRAYAAKLASLLRAQSFAVKPIESAGRTSCYITLEISWEAKS